MDLLPHQDEASKARDKFVVLRWARQTGKDKFIKAMFNDQTDCWVFPDWQRAMVHSPTRQPVHYIATPETVANEAKRNQFNRIFLNDAVEYRDLAKVISQLEGSAIVGQGRATRPLCQQLYIISTPKIAYLPTSSGFYFDALCARLEIGKLPGYYYSRVGLPEDTPHKAEFDAQGIVSTEELFAGYLSEEEIRVRATQKAS